jgi:hypothetical protein
VVRSNFSPGKAWAPGEYMVEVIGPDGLKHHVGPFKLRQEAEDWIAQNPSDSTPKLTPVAKKLKGRRRRTLE